MGCDDQLDDKCWIKVVIYQFICLVYQRYWEEERIFFLFIMVVLEFSKGFEQVIGI